MLPAPLLCPGHDTERLALKVAESQLAAGLTEPEHGVLTAVVCAPLAFSFVGPCSRKDRPEIIRTLRQLRVPRLVAWQWLRGLVEAGHSEDTLADLESGGLLQYWKLFSGLCITLTPLSAMLLGLELRDLRENDPTAERWMIARPRKIMVRRSVHATNNPATLLNLIDGAPGPVDNAMAAERWMRGRKAVLDEWNELPRLVLGGFPIMRQTKTRKRKVGKKKAKRARQRGGTMAAGRVK
jgi:hypothetical protein